MTGSSDNRGLPNDDRLSPELVQKVAEKVYALWLKDLQIEKERQRPFTSKQNWSKGR